MGRASFKAQMSAAELAALASRLRRVVEEIGTQADAARAARVSLRSMKRFLSGEAMPSAPIVAQLAAEGGWSTDWILTGKGRERLATRGVREKAAEVGKQWAGGAVALEVMTMLISEGLFDAYERAGFSLEEENEESILVIARGIAAALGDWDRRWWPKLTRFSLAVQVATLEHVARRSKRTSPTS